MTTTSVMSRPRAKQCVRRHGSQHRAGAMWQLALGTLTDDAETQELRKTEESQPQLEEKQWVEVTVNFHLVQERTHYKSLVRRA